MRTLGDKVTYLQQHRLLETAARMQATSINIEIDPGNIRFTLEDAQQLWEDLSPGEPFIITSINFDNN